MNIITSLEKLSKSKFRASFHLKKKDIEYIQEKGWNIIKDHCFDFISKRLAPAIIENDGKQTPTHGHPVFVAQHACACCCRGCLNKWHRFKQGINLTYDEINEIVELLLVWLHREFDAYKEIKVDDKKNAKINDKKDIPIQLHLF